MKINAILSLILLTGFVAVSSSARADKGGTVQCTTVTVSHLPRTILIDAQEKGQDLLPDTSAIQYNAKISGKKLLVSHSITILNKSRLETIEFPLIKGAVYSIKQDTFESSGGVYKIKCEVL